MLNITLKDEYIQLEPSSQDVRESICLYLKGKDIPFQSSMNIQGLPVLYVEHRDSKALVEAVSHWRSENPKLLNVTGNDYYKVLGFLNGKQIYAHF